LCCCGSGNYNRKKKVPVVCLAGCQFLVLAITTGKKKVPVVCLAGCAVASVFGSGDYDRKKKSSSCLSGRVVLRPEKKSSSRRQSDYDRKIKKFKSSLNLY